MLESWGLSLMATGVHNITSNGALMYHRDFKSPFIGGVCGSKYEGKSTYGLTQNKAEL